MKFEEGLTYNIPFRCENNTIHIVQLPKSESHTKKGLLRFEISYDSQGIEFNNILIEEFFSEIYKQLDKILE
jgi:hypothetical protein